MEIYIRRLLIASFLAGALILSTGAYAYNINIESKPGSASISKIPILPANKSLRVGERYTYLVRWMGIPIGYASLHIKEIVNLNGREAYHIIAEAESNEFLSKFYRVKDVVRTYIDKNELYTLRFEKYQYEGGYKSEEVIEFDQQNHKATYKSLLNNSTKEFEITEKVQDAASCFYYFRLLDVEVGKSYFLDVNCDEKNWQLEVKVLEARPLELRKIGVINAFVAEPHPKFKGLFVKRGRVWVYLSADENRIPLLFKMQSPWGIVTGVITNYKN